MKIGIGRGHRGIALVVMGAILALMLALGAAPAGAATFSNTGSIAIPATGTTGPANPYPSAIAVSGLTGAVTDVKATLTGLSHTWPGDIQVLLVGPSGQNVVLLSGVGGATDVVNANLTFEDAAPTVVPSIIVSGTYRPTAATPFVGPPPAPPSPYGVALAIFNGTVGNGTWKLFVHDSTSGDTGSISGGWSLDITTNGPTITSFAPSTAPPGSLVVITGTNFTGVTGVTFGGTPAAGFTVNSATQITATVPTGATTGPISVATTNGSADSLTSFQVSPPPTVTGLSPTSGRVGQTVTLTGTAFTGATAVRFGGTPAAMFTVLSATQITAKVPAGAGTGPVAVSSPGGTGTSSQRFVVKHARSISLTVTSHSAKGRLTALDGFSKSAASVQVRLQVKKLGAWRTIARDLTTGAGRYGFQTSLSAGRYRVLAPQTTLATGDVALRAVSPTARR
jgi:subtilisin-like proprotein convertase family protein